jgi:hypothetical protein
MEAEMKAVRAVSLTSVAKIVGIYYAVRGLISNIAYVASGTGRFTTPLGIVLPFLDFKFKFAYDRPLWMPGIFSQVLFSTLFYGLSGLLSGLFCGLAYNLVSKYIGIRLMGVTDPSTPTDARIVGA